MKEILEMAIQLAEVAYDWNLDFVEINGEMTSVIDLRNIFVDAIERLPNDARGKT